MDKETVSLWRDMMVVLYSVTGITSFDRYGALNVGTEIGGFLVSNTRGEGDYTVGRVVRLESSGKIW